MLIRPVKSNELKQLQDIGRTTFAQAFSTDNSETDMKKYLDQSFSLEKLSAELGNSNSSFFFVEFENQIIAYLKLNKGSAQTDFPLENALEIERIYVLSDFIGKSIGKQLIEKSLEVARRENLDRIWLGVWDKNSRAVRFYEKNGFKIFSTHQFKLGEEIQNDFLMKLELTGSDSISK